MLASDFSFAQFRCERGGAIQLGQAFVYSGGGMISRTQQGYRLGRPGMLLTSAHAPPPHPSIPSCRWNPPDSASTELCDGGGNTDEGAWPNGTCGNLDERYIHVRELVAAAG